MAVATQTTQSKQKKRRRSWTRWWLLALVVLAAGGGAWTLLARRGGAPSDAGAGPQTVTLTPKSYRIGVAGPGTIAAAASVELTAPVAGTLTRLASVGERVEAGQVVAGIEPGPFDTVRLEAATGFTFDDFDLERPRVPLVLSIDKTIALEVTLTLRQLTE